MSTYNINSAGNVSIQQVVSEAVEAVRLMLVGRTGSGKSSSGNTILKEDRFPVTFSARSVTKRPCLEEGGKFTDGSSLKVMDTPGLFDTDTTHEDTAKQLQEALANMTPGPHAILYVVSLGSPYSDEDFKTFQRLKQYFGAGFLRYAIVVFTHADRLDEEGLLLESLLKDSTENLKTMLQECGMRYVAFNNKNPSDRAQVKALFDKIQEFGKVFYVRPFLSTEEFDQTMHAADQGEFMGSASYKSLNEEIRQLRTENKELREERDKSSAVEQIKHSLQSLRIELYIGFALTCLVVFFRR